MPEPTPDQGARQSGWACESIDPTMLLTSTWHLEDLEKQIARLRAEITLRSSEYRADLNAQTKYIDECEESIARLRAENARKDEVIKTLHFDGTKTLDLRIWADTFTKQYDPQAIVVRWLRAVADAMAHLDAATPAESKHVD